MKRSYATVTLVIACAILISVVAPVIQTTEVGVALAAPAVDCVLTTCVGSFAHVTCHETVLRYVSGYGPQICDYPS